MFSYLVPLISSYGYFGIFAIMLANSDFLPTVTEFSLPFAGFLASKGILSVWLIVLSAVLGDVLGATIAYWLGFFLEEKLILRLISKYGKYVFLREKDYVRVVELIRRRGTPIVFLAKLTPGLKAWTSLASGICEIPFRSYIFVSAIASAIYNTIFVFLGYYLGRNWQLIVHYFTRFQLIIFALLLGILVVAFLLFINHKLKLVKLPKGFSRF